MANDFNFSANPFENERLPRLVFGAVAAIVLGTTIVHGFFLTRYLLREREELDIQVADLRSSIDQTNAEIQRLAGSLSQQRSALATERTGFLSRIYRHKSFSWTGLFNELEAITPADVRIVSIAPRETDGNIEVTLSVVGRTLTNVLEMVRALEANTFFGTVYPLDEVDLEELGNGETGIAATLRLEYVDPIPDDPHAPDGMEPPPADVAPLPDDESEPEPEPAPETAPVAVPSEAGVP